MASATPCATQSTDTLDGEQTAFPSGYRTSDSASMQAETASPSTVLNNSIVAGMASLEDTIRQIMEDQVTRLGVALELRIDMRAAESSKHLAAAEFGLRAEKQEREHAMMALQRDMLTLTDSAVKERELIERVIQDQALVHAMHADIISRTQNLPVAVEGQADSAVTVEALEARVEELHKRIDEMFSSQQEEVSTLIDQKLAEVRATIWPRQRLGLHSAAAATRQPFSDSMINENDLCLEEQYKLLLSLEARIAELAESCRKGYDETTEMNTERAARSRSDAEFKLALEEMRNDLAALKAKDSASSVEGLRMQVVDLQDDTWNRIEMLRSELDPSRLGVCDRSSACNTAGVSDLRARIDGFQQMLEDCCKESTKEIEMERRSRKKSVDELGESLSACNKDLSHRCELLESDLIDLTRTLKRMDLRVKEVARISATRCFGAISQTRRTPSAAPDSDNTRANAVQPFIETGFEPVIETGFEEVDRVMTRANSSSVSTPPVSESPEKFPAGDSISISSIPLTSAQQSRIDLLKRAAGTSTGIHTMLRRALELGEI